MYFTSIFKVAYLLTFVSHPPKPRDSHLASKKATIVSKPQHTIITPTLLNSEWFNWLTHQHILHHTVEVQCLCIHYQNPATEPPPVTVLSSQQTGNARLVVAMKHNASRSIHQLRTYQ